MSSMSLTAKYRPQTFSQLAGQETIKTILSRASLEQKVAPAYLFSGTRGVGKTTVARIFAKALNCRNAPTAEPCNECDQCRSITAGSAVDVIEIDGASNRGIDDVRRLKEVVGYAPMEGGYKIFIIDEAHMLSREAFNALLKTLEEPPARVTFMLATTEPHKFPATIISRCQHYVFKPLSEPGLVEHLSSVLQAEQVEFDVSALRLIARRGAGSVRDSMSLLGQVLALGGGKLTEESTRNVLGLAGQEAFLTLLQACKSGDALSISRLLRDMLDQGLDIGFFLRELAALWRNLFMLRQSGEAALQVVDIPENEGRRYLETAKEFSLQYIHACWHMTLEGQRRVLTSLEPALALELLLLNIGMLPQILSLEKLSALNRKAGGGNPGNVHSPAGKPQGRMNARQEVQPAGTEARADTAIVASEASVVTAEPHPGAVVSEDTDCARALKDSPSPRSSDVAIPITPSIEDAAEYDDAALQRELQEDEPAAQRPALAEVDAAPESTGQGDALQQKSAVMAQKAAAPIRHPDWESMFTLCQSMESPPWLVSLLKRLDVFWEGDVLTLEAHDEFALRRLNDPSMRAQFEELLVEWCGGLPHLEFSAKVVQRKTRDDIKAELKEHPLVKEIEETLGGYVIDYGQLHS